MELPLLPPLPADFVEVAPTGFDVSSWPTDEVLVLTTTYTAATEEDDDGAAEGAAAKRRGPKTKAELAASLADRDPYRLLELDDLRWRASADDIKKAYRRMVLKHHPDKQMGAEAAEERVAKKQERRSKGGDDDDEDEKKEESTADEADEMFKAITEAFELLSDGKRRRDFDSLDDFDDSIPPKDFDENIYGDFYEMFGPVFERNSRWSELPKCPLLGSKETPYAEVSRFYQFWFDFKSWRDFADADEYDVEEAGFREEKRWMERENNKLRAKKRKAEASRIQKLVDLSYQNDPRVQAEKQRAKDAKTAAKAERAAALQRDKDKVAAEKAAKEAAKAAEEEAVREKEKAEAAERKKLKEKQQKAVRKARSRLRGLIAGDGRDPLCDDVSVELLCARLDAEKLDGLCVSLEAVGDGNKMKAEQKALVKAAIEAEQSAAEQEEARLAAEKAEKAKSDASSSGSKVPWTDDELNLLVKAANKFPGGVPDRWGHMAEFINHLASPSNSRTADDVIAKVKERRQELDRKKAKEAMERDRVEGRTPPKPPPSEPKEEKKAEPPQAKPPAAAAPAPAPATAAAPATTAKDAGDWSDEQQRCLEGALKKFPNSKDPERWERISEEVPGKTKGECVRRYKEIVAALKAKKEAAAAASG